MNRKPIQIWNVHLGQFDIMTGTQAKGIAELWHMGHRNCGAEGYWTVQTIMDLMLSGI